MTALIVIGIILLVFVAIGSIRATVYLQYRDDVKLSVSVAGIRIGILPKKEKKVNINKYSAKRFRKMLEKKQLQEEAKQLKKKRKDEQKKAKKLARAEEKKKQNELEALGGKKKEKLSLPEVIGLVTDIILVFFSRFGRHFRINVAKLNITVATDDAATTAVLYGVAVQGVEYILALLDKAVNVDYKENAEINVNVDYLSESSSADLDISFSLRVWHLFDIIFRVAFRAIKKLFSSKIKNNI